MVTLTSILNGEGLKAVAVNYLKDKAPVYLKNTVGNYVIEKVVDIFWNEMPTRRSLIVYAAGGIAGIGISSVLPWYVPSVVAVGAGCYLARQGDRVYTFIEDQSSKGLARAQNLFARLWPNRIEKQKGPAFNGLQQDHDFIVEQNNKVVKNLNDFSEYAEMPLEEVVAEAQVAAYPEQSSSEYVTMPPTDSENMSLPSISPKTDEALVKANEESMAFAELFDGSVFENELALIDGDDS